MRLDLFSRDDTVLLLGEGNFSFSVSLHKHKLPIKITATGFEEEAFFEHYQENIDYLESNKVPVFRNIDATKLRENALFSGVKFSKIIFNFPHVGGKMKIHLNRELLRKVFENSSAILAEDGLMIMSLCRGQGGTPADKPQRRWDDSWQVTEMAAHGNFVLTAVEPFLPENFPEYKCIGYRSQDTRFHLNGALVHVFAKRKPPYDPFDDSVPIRRLSLAPFTPGSRISLPLIYSEIYQNNPIENSDSPISFMKELLLLNLTQNSVNSEWDTLNDDELPFYVKSGNGVSCFVNGDEFKLRATPFDILPELLQLLAEKKPIHENVLFPGTYFSPLTKNFSLAPLRVDVAIAGKNLLIGIERFLKNLIDLFVTEDVDFLQEDGENDLTQTCYAVTSSTNLILKNTKSLNRVSAAIFFHCRHKEVNTEICVVNVQTLCELFFDIGWREIWSNKPVVVNLQKLTVKLSSLYPSEYKFDITLRYTEPYFEDRFFELLWLAAGELIKDAELLSDYASEKDWHSKCYRLTYWSLDKPLFKNRAKEIHSKIVTEVLKLGLNITIG